MQKMDRGREPSKPRLAVGISRTIRFGILLTDACVLVAATFFGFLTRFSLSELQSSLLGPIQIVGTITPILWLAVLVIIGSYEQRVVGLGLSEYGKVFQSALWMLAIVSIVSFLGKFDTSRAYVLIAIPLGLIGLLVDRWLWRRWIVHMRKRGNELQSTLVIGTLSDQERIRAAFEERSWAGYAIVAGCDPPETALDQVGKDAWLASLIQRIESERIMCVALSPSCALTSVDIRELSWRIEGRGIDLLISSSLGAVTGPRISLRVATGLPFMHLDEVGIGLTNRAIKRFIDVVVSAIALIILGPLLLIIAATILITSGRPIVFSQERAGARGNLFTVRKFRTMVHGADSQREILRDQFEQIQPTAKFVDDPRVTPVGHFLRRWSLDELPQLVNVFQGSMSLVGPRPHPLDDVRRYSEADERRLLAKPGMTGLWQVAGRSDLSWDDAVELDLLYIENWSVLSDLTILLRTIQAVFTRRGAY